MGFKVKTVQFLLFVMVFGMGTVSFAWAQEKPRDLRYLQNLEPEVTLKDLTEAEENPSIVRDQAQFEAGLSFGARGGLAYQTYQIAKQLEGKHDFLDKTFDFKRLLITAPSGLLVEPPIISEAEDVLLIESNGQEAAVADKLLNIGREARIVSAPRDWREYLIRTWGVVDPPPDLLLPQSPEEREAWREAVAKGFQQGIEQADEIFDADLALLTADFTGMVRYRMLLAQGIVSAPFTLQVDRGITGGGRELRVGDRALRITGPSQFQTGATQWQPASR